MGTAMHRCVMAGALLALPLAALPQTAERPVVQPGDQWRFVEWYTVPSTTPTRHWVITAVTPAGIEGTENGEPLLLSPDLSVLDSPRARESRAASLRFPLAVGKRWRYESDWLFKVKGSSGTMSVEVAVTAYEKVRVPAGEFDAFRLVSTRQVRGRSSFGSVIDGENVSTFWYAPAARAVVKAVSRNPYIGPSTVELVDYELRP